MPRLIVKFQYWQNGRSRNARASNYMNYIATREGVDRMDDAWKAKKATAKQKKLIDALVRKHSEIARTEEYRKYSSAPCRGNASALVDGLLDEVPEFFDDNRTYLAYMATRPRAERLGMHGLFSDDGQTLDLAEECNKLRAFDGRVHTLIVSLKREDAENTGFNCAERWRAFLRTQKLELAKRYDIPAEQLRWFGAFHDESYHPHVHLMLYSADPRHPGFISRKGLESLKSAFATEIFKVELTEIYQEQTKQRDELIWLAREEAFGLVMEINDGENHNRELEEKMRELAEKLKSVRGRKQYGYMPPEIKNLIDGITDGLCEDERIKRLYDLWYESKYRIMRSYTDRMPTQKPLSQENAFKPIRNAILQEALHIREEMRACEEAQTQNDGRREIERERYDAEVIANAAVDLLRSVSMIFEDRIDEELRVPQKDVLDSKMRREQWAKEHGVNLRM